MVRACAAHPGHTLSKRVDIALSQNVSQACRSRVLGKSPNIRPSTPGARYTHLTWSSLHSARILLKPCCHMALKVMMCALPNASFPTPISSEAVLPHLRCSPIPDFVMWPCLTWTLKKCTRRRAAPARPGDLLGVAPDTCVRKTEPRPRFSPETQAARSLQ